MKNFLVSVLVILLPVYCYGQKAELLIGFFGISFGESSENVMKQMAEKQKKTSLDNSPPKIILDTIRVYKTLYFNNVARFSGRKLKSIECDFNEFNQFFRATLYFDSNDQHLLADSIADDLTIKYGNPKNKLAEQMYVKASFTYNQTIWEWFFPNNTKIICNKYWKPNWTGKDFHYTEELRLTYQDDKLLEAFANISRERLQKAREEKERQQKKMRQEDTKGY